ncbi:baseplate assembly protein (plasmid) [Ralstonia pseudosolanacearum]|uniref:baseplate J/gp47 family protein n=1 Tax=Ralstonia pseudosolanacearum TaxID=1310165 RepID=UPI00090AB685|nr:baseplate J/gp47 family protein [Ralstonia pseudosolanacearum]API77953.1 baseplate assembly protein [Ralstonia pseudosolanacearum]
MTAYVRPPYTDLKARIAADLAAMPAVLRGPLAAMWGRATHGMHGHLEWILAQCSPLTCELERLYDWAALYGVDRLMATAGTGNALATGVAGTPILAGTTLRGSNGLDYSVVAAVNIGAGATTPVSIRCTTTGSASNLAAGLTLTVVDPLPGVNGTLTVDDAGITGGDEDESVDGWRARVADEWTTITTRGARSGKDDDYRFWARSAHPSVTTALIQRHVLGMGTIIVRPICNTLTDRMPTAAVLTAVAAYLQDIAPATADWRVVAPLRRDVNPSIHLLAGSDTGANRNAVFSALMATVLAEVSETSVLAMAEVDAAIATVTTQYTRLAPTADIAVAAGEVLVMSPVVWA